MKATLKRALSVLCALALCIGLLPVSALAAGADETIYSSEETGITIKVTSGNIHVEKTINFTVIVDGSTVVKDRSVKVAAGTTDLNVDAAGYDVSFETTNGMTVAKGINNNYNVGLGGPESYDCIINLASTKTKDDITISTDETVYGIFSWSKQHAGNSAYPKDIEIYVNGNYACTQTVNTPRTLSNIVGSNQEFWFTPGEDFNPTYEMDRRTLDSASNQKLRIDLTTKCPCGRDTCLCEGGNCGCGPGCECPNCMGTNLEDNQINTGYGIIEYMEPGSQGGYRLQVKINLNGTIVYTSDWFRVYMGSPGNLKFTPTAGKYFFQNPNSYDIVTLRSGSTWSEYTGQLSIAGVTQEVRDYDNILTINLVSFDNKVTLDVERRLGAPTNQVIGYRVSYTLEDKEYTYDYYNFAAAQAPNIPTNVPVTITAICNSPYEVAEWSTGNAHAGNVTLTGSEGQDGTEAYGNSVTLTVNSAGDTTILLYIENLGTVTVPDDDDLIDPDTGLLKDNAVTIDCTNEKAQHSDRTYGLKSDTYTIGTLGGNSADGYTCDITVTNTDPYVTSYNTDVSDGHTLDPVDQGQKIITLKWVNGEWTVPTGKAPVTYTVKCKTEPGSGEDISGFSKEVVTSKVEEIEGSYNYPVVKDGQNVVTITEGDADVTLLYAITVTGTPNTEFTVTDKDATLVSPTDGSITQGTDDKADKFTGTIPESGTITFYVSKTFKNVNKGDTLTNSATVTGGDTEKEDGEDVVVDEETTGPDVSVEKKLTGIEHKDGTPVEANDITNETVLLIGDELTWTITVTNNGDEKAEGLKLTDTLTAVNADGNSLARTAEVNAKKPANNDPNNFAVGANSSATFTATYTVTEADKGLILKNTAAVGDVAPGDDPSDETENPVEDPKVSIVKTLSSVNGVSYTEGEKVDVGDVLTYEIKVTNTGNVKLDDVVITDSLWGKTGVTSVKVNNVEQEFDVPNGYVCHIKGLEVEDEATITYTYTVQDSDAGKTIKNTAAVSGDDIEDNGGDTEEVKVTNPDMSVEKALTAINGGEVPDTFFTVDVGDVLTYTITVKNTGTEKLNVTVSDSLWGEKTGVTSVKVNNVEQTLDVPNGYVCHINGIDVEETVTITYSYTVTADDVLKGSIVNNVTVDGGDDDGTDDDEVTVWTGNVTITPANITVYTGGDVYSNIVDANGSPVSGKTSGLPEPGYHIDLPEAVTEWLKEHGVDTTEKAADLAGILKFRYYDENGTEMLRNWNLVDQGVYSRDNDGNITRYVYSLSPNTAEGDDKGVKVRLQFTDPSNPSEPIISDDITMTEDLVSDKYKMTIYDGGLEQQNIVAVLTVGNESITCNVEVGTGELTVRSTTNKETTNEIASAETDVDDNVITAVGNATYYVNNSEVEVDPGRVQLLVDEVSNSPAFDESMGKHAIETVTAKLSNAAYDLAYLDLVDTKNGNAVVTMDKGDSLTIYWPVPDDAADDSEFHIVHYTDMNRENTVTDLDSVKTEPITVRRDGDHLTFTVTSFSPFVLVYEEEDEPYVPPVDDDDDDRPAHRPHRPDRDDEPEELNTEDHVAYLIGFTDGTIRPEANISRAEVATIFFRLLTDEARETYWSQYSPYSDVKADAWYNNAVCTLSNMGILDGYPDGTFRPDAPITRSEFTKVAISFFDYAEGYYVYGGEFSDVTGAEWFASYLAAALDYGLIEGMPDGTFRPLNNISRAEACTIVNRTLGREPDGDHLLSRREMITWPDNSTSAWYYADMQEATNSHDYYWDEDDEVEEWTEKLEERDWAALERTWSDAHDAPGGEVMD